MSSCKDRTSSQAEHSDGKETCPAATTDLGICIVPMVLAVSWQDHTLNTADTTSPFCLVCARCEICCQHQPAARTHQAWGHEESKSLLPPQCGHSLFSTFAPPTPGHGHGGRGETCEVWLLGQGTQESSSRTGLSQKYLPEANRDLAFIC